MIKSIALRAAAAAMVLGSFAAPLHAQTAPFEVNPDRVSYTGGNTCKNTTFVVPTYYLYVEGRNSVTAADRSVSAKTKVFVDGYTTGLLQGIARELYDDLIAKLRAAGATVITYDDIKAETAGFSLEKPNPKIGAPTRDSRALPGHDFLMAAPSDAQYFSNSGMLAAPTRPFQNIIKARNATILMPELWLTLPQMWGQKQGGTYYASVGIYGSPAMKMSAFITSGGSATKWCAMYIQEHGVRLAADDVGEFTKLGSDRQDYGDWARSRSDYTFAIDPARFRAGVLRVGTSINAYVTRTQMTGK